MQINFSVFVVTQARSIAVSYWTYSLSFSEIKPLKHKFLEDIVIFKKDKNKGQIHSLFHLHLQTQSVVIWVLHSIQ